MIRRTISPPPNTTSAEYWSESDKLATLARQDIREFLRQIIVYEATQKSLKQPFTHGFAYAWLIHAQIDPENYPDALSDLLYCRDQEIRNEARMLLRGSLRRIHADGQVDLSHFRDHILGSFQKASTAAPLKRALFETIPAEAFLFYSGEWSIGEVDRNDVVPYRRKWRIVDNALFDKRWLGGISGGKLDLATATTLRDLATSEYWWSRMFVAEVMVQHKEFRDADLIQRLKTDENELVRNSITSLESADPLRVSPVDQ